MASAVAYYIAFKYNVAFSDVFAVDVIATTRQEVSGFITSQLILFWVLYIVFFIIAAFFFGKFKITLFNFKNPKAKLAADVLFCVLFLLSIRINCYPLRAWYVMINKLYMAKTDLADFIPQMRMLEKQDEPSVLEKPLPKESLVFFHIGESVRGGHAPMNGYKRNTMPQMLKEHKSGNLFSFRNAVSFADLTRISVVGMITPSSINDPVIRSSSFIPFLKKNGIKLAAFFSSVDPYTTTTRLDSTISVYASGISDHFVSPDTAHSLLPQLRNFFAAHGNGENRFILYQGEGSHMPYRNYDKKRFSAFMPVNFNQNANNTTTNAYDNTILCTDDFMHEIIGMMRAKNSVYIYASDHGDLMGDEGYWGRKGALITPNTNKALRNILFFIWVSDRFKKENPEKFAALRNNAANLSSVSHDHLYHTVLGLYNIKNGYYDKSLDLFSASAKPFAGPMPEELAAITFFGKFQFAEKK